MAGPKPVRLPDLYVGKQPNSIELAFRQMGMTPEDLKASQQGFALRREAFHHDFPRAIPGGMVSGAGDFLGDVGSVNLPFLPPLLPKVKQQTQSLTDHLTARLHEFFGVDPQTEGGQTGQEIGEIASAFLPYEAAVPIARGLGKGIGVLGREMGKDLAPAFRDIKSSLDPLAKEPPYGSGREATGPLTREEMDVYRKHLRDLFGTEQPRP